MFRKKTPEPPAPEPVVQKTPAEYPKGLCVRTEAGIFYIAGNFRHRITSDEVLASWSFPFVGSATEAALVKYPVLKKLGFRQGTVIQDITDSKYYLVTQGCKRQIVDPRVFDRLGIDKSKALLVSDEDAGLHTTGEVLR